MPVLRDHPEHETQMESKPKAHTSQGGRPPQRNGVPGRVHMRLLYLATVLPYLLYACSVWYAPHGEQGHDKGVVKTLASIQYRATRIITGAYRATAIPTPNIEAHMLPIHQRLAIATGTALLRIMRHSIYNHINNSRNTPFWNTLGQDWNLFPQRWSPLEKLSRHVQARPQLPSLTDLE